MTNDARYRWRLLRAGPILLDGGGMFGVVPKAVWGRAVPSDDQNRISLAHNCLLLERVGDGAASHPRRILIETGSGDKQDEKTRQIFGLTGPTAAAAVEEAGARCDDIDAVVVSHLHFDHAGGLTRRATPGETPDWVDPRARIGAPDPPGAPGGAGAPGGVKLAFPRAAIHVQRREWEDANLNRSVMTRTYLRDHLDPIRDRLRLADSPPPFATGHLPRRDESPPTPLRDRETEVLPGVFVFLVPGHTWGQQAVRFVDERGRHVVFTPDVLPTVHHVGAAYSLAYDVDPYTSMVTRRWFLAEAVEREWVLILDHEPANPRHRVRPDGKGWFTLIPEET